MISGGLAKFTPAEAQLIQPLMAHSPFFAWLYGVTSVQCASNLTGVVEIVLGILLALHRWWPRLAMLGGLGAVAEFIFTLSFLFTTPNLSMDAQGFLMKDLMLFGAAAWTAADSLRAPNRDR